MRIPKAWLRHRVGLAGYLGTDATGPLYGVAEERPAYVEAVSKTARSPEGREVIAGTAVWVQLDRAITAEWRVTADGRVRDVVEVRHYDARLGTPDHTQILCQ